MILGQLHRIYMCCTLCFVCCALCIIVIALFYLIHLPWDGGEMEKGVCIPVPGHSCKSHEFVDYAPVR